MSRGVRIIPGSLAAPPEKRRSSAARIAAAILILLLFCAGVLLLVRYGRVRGLDAVTDRGVALLEGLEDADAIDEALKRWYAEANRVLATREDDWLQRVFEHYPIDHLLVRRLVTFVTGADFGPRLDEWNRWFTTRARLRSGGQPQAAGRDAVECKRVWDVPVGLTAAYSSILPIDGRIFVASLGNGFELTDDSADGVVRVDALTHRAEVIFEPPDKPPHDVLGLALGDGVLFVSCRNGFVYCIDADGRLRWKSFCGGKIVSLPLAFDANSDGVEDVAVVTESGRVVAISSSGRGLWSTPVDIGMKPKFDDGLMPTAERAAIRASLAFGPLPGSTAHAVLVTTWKGGVIALSPSSGKTIWHIAINAGIAASPLLIPAAAGGEPGAFVADAGGSIWTLYREDKRMRATALWSLSASSGNACVGGLRSASEEAGAHAIVACTAGDPLAELARGSVALLGAQGVRWRLPIDGFVRCGPAVADLNADGRADMLVLSSLFGESQPLRTLMTFVAHDGRVLKRYGLDVAVECAPVVADVDGDGKLDALICDRGGTLTCYSLERFGEVHWGLLGGDPRNNYNALDAFTFSQTPVKYQWKWKPGAARRK